MVKRRRPDCAIGSATAVFACALGLTRVATSTAVTGEGCFDLVLTAQSAKGTSGDTESLAGVSVAVIDPSCPLKPISWNFLHGAISFVTTCCGRTVRFLGPEAVPAIAIGALARLKRGSRCKNGDQQKKRLLALSRSFQSLQPLVTKNEP